MEFKRTITRRKFVTTSVGGVTASALLPINMASAQSVSGLYDEMPVTDRILGDENAPVTLLEYASMTCPHCKAFHERAMPPLKAKYIDSGKVKYIVRPFPFSGDHVGHAAFMLALCAPNDNYYGVLDVLFKTQAKWARSQDPVTELLNIAKLAGMSKTEFETCLKDQSLLNKVVEMRTIAIERFAVRATPTLFVNDKRFTDAGSVENLSAAFDALLTT